MELLKRLGIKYPVVQAPMAGVTTPELVAACANEGILGSVGAGYLNGEKTKVFIQAVKKMTDQPFMVNVFVPEAFEVDEVVLQQASDALAPIRELLGVAEMKLPTGESHYAEQIEVILEEQVPICSFTFGLPSEEVVARLKAQAIYVIGTATTVEEARLAEAIGMDAVVAQGAEAGGHRGSFHGDLTMVPLTELVREINKAVQIPIIAAGGIANKEMMDEVMNLGATAIQIGTALLVTEESGAHPLHKEAILQSKTGDAVVTTAFSGKAARGLENTFMKKMKEETIAPYPLQNTLTQAIRKASSDQGKTDYMSLWAGTSAHLSEAGRVETIVRKFL